MSDEVPAASWPYFLDETAGQWLSRHELPPTGFTKLAQALEPDLGSVSATLDQWIRANRRAEEGVTGRQRRNSADRVREPFEVAYDLPIPTQQELEKTDADLRARVLPGAPEQELRQAVEKIPAEPEKLNLAATLTNALKYASSISTPWVVFVLVYWMATKLNADEVGALALAFAVMCGAKPGG
jgi:hypothetical protein